MRATLEGIKRVQSMPYSPPLAGTSPGVDRRHICRECGYKWSERTGGEHIIDIACSIARATIEFTNSETEWEKAIDIAINTPLADLCDSCLGAMEAERK